MPVLCEKYDIASESFGFTVSKSDHLIFFCPIETQCRSFRCDYSFYFEPEPSGVAHKNSKHVHYTNKKDCIQSLNGAEVLALFSR